ncbi:cupin domain-containing protein [Pseudomonas izuensis]|uniref:cupin domain-containing protein n=1 Tax=Pseudomonas izuensis TaxID=2684212 RepID=UPI00135AC232|nr:cupin domain-containing protein [Pseudomonas izuensis]
MSLPWSTGGGLVVKRDQQRGVCVGGTSMLLRRILEGACGVLLEDEDEVWLSAGDFLLINNNDSLRIVSKDTGLPETSPYGAVGDVEMEMMRSTPKYESKVLCASVIGTKGATSTFFKLLPDRLLLPSSLVAVESPFRRMVNLLNSELAKEEGTPWPVTGAFVKCALGLAFREMIHLNYSRCGLLSLCAHPTLSRYVSSMINDPQRGWSLEASPGVFYESSEREVIEISGFTSATISQLLRVLMSFPLLTSSRKTLLQIGVMMGYNSAAEFSQAFKDSVGGAPDNFRIPREGSCFP